MLSLYSRFEVCTDVQRRLKLTGSKTRLRLGPKWFEFDMRKTAEKYALLSLCEHC